MRLTCSTGAGVSPSAAAIAADAVLTSYHAVKGLAKVQPHETILMYGLGGVGLNGLQAMMHLGPKRVIVVEKRQELLDEAIKLGVPAKDAFCPSEETKVEDYLSAQKIVVDTAVDFVGADSTFASAQMSGKCTPSQQSLPLAEIQLQSAPGVRWC